MMSGDESSNTNTNGYTADDSSGNNEEETDESSAGGKKGIGPGFIVDVDEHGSKHFSYPRRRQLRKRPLGVPTSLPKSAPSPIHPDIDISLTRHVIGTDMMKGRPVTGSGSAARSHQVDALSQLLIDYFGAVRRAGLQRKTGSPRNNDHTSSSKSPAEVKSEKTKQPPSPSTRKVSEPPSSGNDTPPCPSEPAKVESPVPQIIADIPLSESHPTTTFSTRQRRLEEALELTQIPRLLIEATAPHRVVHTNAAFSKSVIQNTSNIQRWIEKQNASSIPENRTLQQALEDMIPENTTVPLSVYPVHGSSYTVSHYLIEASSEPSRKRRRFDELPSRAIG